MPRARATIDFETRSVAKIKDVGGWMYSVHWSTEPICLAFALDEADEPRLWAPDWAIEIVEPWYLEEYGVPLDMDCPWLYAGDCPRDLAIAITMNYEVEAHNAFFERAIWGNIMTPQFGWLKINENQWRCSAAKASSYALPRALEDAVKALNLPFPKDMEGNRIMLKLARPRKARKAEKKELLADGWSPVEGSVHEWTKPGCGPPKVLWNEKPEDIFRTWEYCRQDVRAERGLSQALADLSPDELAVWRADQTINLRGIRIDRKMAEQAISIAEQAVDDATERAIEAATVDKGDGRIILPPFKTLGQRDKLISWIEDRGVVIPNMQGETIDNLLKESLPEDVKTVLQAKRTASRTSVRKYAKMLETASPEDDRIRDVLMYHGAGTGRWTGRFVQTQNFVRGKMKDPDTMCGVILEGLLDWLMTCYGPADPMEVLSWATRGAIISSPGRDLMVADYAGVEARGLLWFVDDPDGLAIFRRPKGEPGIYREMASEIYRIPAGDIDKNTHEGFVQRFMGKQAILGLGYGMGPPKFRDTCAKYGQEVSLDFSKFVVKTYRDRFSKVVDSWKRLEKAAIKAVRNPETPFHADKVIYLRKGNFLYCRLPSGRKLAYCKPTIVPSRTPWGEVRPKLTYMTVDGKTRKWVRTDTYGGKLMENIIQGMCRDLEAYAIVTVETDDVNPYDVVMHTHDELVAEVDEGEGDVKEFEQLISMLPAWADGFPLKAEGWRGKRYRK